MSITTSVKVQFRATLRLLLLSVVTTTAFSVGNVISNTPTRVTFVPHKPYGYEVDTCHDIYMEQSANASSVYDTNFKQCETVANRSLRHLALDEETERAQIEAGAATICENLDRCNLLESDYEYFGCNVEIGPINLDIIVDIRFNASRGYTNLRDDFDHVQQEFLLCTIEAQRLFVNDMRSAYDELMQCRVQFEMKDEEMD